MILQYIYIVILLQRLQGYLPCCTPVIASWTYNDTHVFKGILARGKTICMYMYNNWIESNILYVMEVVSWSICLCDCTLFLTSSSLLQCIHSKIITVTNWARKSTHAIEIDQAAGIKSAGSNVCKGMYEMKYMHVKWPPNTLNYVCIKTSRYNIEFFLFSVWVIKKYGDS